jgi:hypothetical protein
MSDTVDAQADGAGKLAVRLPAALLAKVDTAARKRGLGRSAFVREALATQVSAVLEAQEGPTLHELLVADGVLGRYSGPAELSRTSRTVLRGRIERRHRGPATDQGATMGGSADRQERDRAEVVQGCNLAGG